MFLEFARDSKVYVLDGNSVIRLRVTEVSFNQTFKQKTIQAKTLHDLSNLYEGSAITTANPAKFSINFPMFREVGLRQHKLLQLGIDTTSDNQLNTFTLYVETESDSNITTKLSNCIVKNINFNISRGGLMVAEVSGEGTKLERIPGPLSDASNNELTSTQKNSKLNAESQFLTPTNAEHAFSKNVTVEIGGSVLDFVFGVNLEIQNQGKWLKYETLQDSLNVTNAATSMYPSTWSLNERTVAGSIAQYIDQSSTTASTNLQTWSENSSIRIRAGNDGVVPQLDANLTPCSFTNRINPSEIFSQNYDYRLLSGGNTLSSLITYLQPS